MTIDKSWTKLRNRLSVEFRSGLNEFIEYAKSFINGDGKISCPCKMCLNTRYHPLKTVYAHIFDKGFDPTYNTWIFHGEPPVVIEPPYVTEQPAVVTEPLVEEMADVVNDFLGHGDVQYGDDDLEDTNQDVISELLSKLQDKLYPGCETSSLHFLAQLMHIKVLFKWPNESVDQLLKLLDKILPEGSKLPTSFYKAKKLLSKLGLGYEMIHACPHDCALYWKENAHLQSCPVCNTSRWKMTKGKKVPFKVLRYFPLKDRLKRLYASRHTAKEMTWHQRGRSSDPNVMCHPVDGKEWKDFDENYPDFAREPRNVRLGLAADGFNPFGNMSLSYSMWPVVTIVYNLPPWLCNKDPYRQLTLLIPGPNSPGKDIDVYLRPMVDELQELWSEGVIVRDAASNNMFRMRVALLMTINDFPARSSLSGWSGQGYKACPTCNDQTPSVRITSKTCYVGHRQWLPINHPMRKNKQFDGTVEHRPPPARKTTEEILEQLENVQSRLPGKHVQYGGKKRKRHPIELNWSKKSIFWNLPYWSSLTLRHNLDVMHIEKNVCDSLLGTLLNIEGKSKDTDKARIDLEEMNVRKELHLYKDGNRWMKPHAAYVLTPENNKKVCEFLRNVRFPDGFASNLRKNINTSNTYGKVMGLKSHDCHVILQRLLPTMIRKYMRKDIVDAITELSNFFKLLCSRILRVSDVENARDEVVMILCKLETIFPPAFFDIMVHLVMHLPEEAIRGGPVFLRWMYSTERFLGTLKKYVKNRARPEGSIAEAYIVNETLTFCSMYFNNIETRFNKPERNWVQNEDENTGKISVFQNRFRPIGKVSYTILDKKLMEQAAFYVLQNCPEIEEYLVEHKNTLAPNTIPEILNDVHSRKFSEWFRSKMFSLRQADSPAATEELMSLASGCSFGVHSCSACVVNGVKFLTYIRDNNRTTQNSGICVKGPCDLTYYGILEGIYELLYIGSNSVIIFKCKWFNTDPSSRNRPKEYKNRISICTKDSWCENEPFILASQAEQVFYVDDLYNGKDWKVVEHFCHRHIYPAFPSVDEEDVVVVDEINGDNFQLVVELPPLEEIPLSDSNVQADVVNSNVEEIRQGSSSCIHDDFINDEDNDTIDEYTDDDEATDDELFDDDIDDGEHIDDNT